MKTIKKILITGGPCGGKTNFVKLAKPHFEALGYSVIICNETATDLLTGGITPVTMGMYEFQSAIFALQIKKEELFIEYAKKIKGDKVIIFFDRGLYDNKAYLESDEYLRMLDYYQTPEEEMNSRYDSILYFLSSASANESQYGTQDNEARYEDLEKAKIVDTRTLESWSKHKNIKVIGFNNDFNQKLQDAIKLAEECIF